MENHRHPLLGRLAAQNRRDRLIDDLDLPRVKPIFAGCLAHLNANYPSWPGGIPSSNRQAAIKDPGQNADHPVSHKTPNAANMQYENV